MQTPNEPPSPEVVSSVSAEIAEVALKLFRSKPWQPRELGKKKMVAYNSPSTALMEAAFKVAERRGRQRWDYLIELAYNKVWLTLRSVVGAPYPNAWLDTPDRRRSEIDEALTIVIKAVETPWDS